MSWSSSRVLPHPPQPIGPSQDVRSAFVRLLSERGRKPWMELAGVFPGEMAANSLEDGCSSCNGGFSSRALVGTSTSLQAAARPFCGTCIPGLLRQALSASLHLSAPSGILCAGHTEGLAGAREPCSLWPRTHFTIPLLESILPTHTSVLRTPVGCVTSSKTPPTLLRGVPAFCAYHNRPTHVLLIGINALRSTCSFSYLLPRWLGAPSEQLLFLDVTPKPSATFSDT